VIDAPRVSVIIPTYNRAPMLGRAIKSVLNQTYRDFELIVVDDCSTDNTEEVVNSFEDARLRYIKHPTNRGGSAARNSGISSSSGDYIGFLDDDDEWLPDKLKVQVELFGRLPEDYGVIYGGYHIKQEGKIIRDVYPTHRGDVYYQMLKGCFIGSPTILIKNVCFENAGCFDETLPGCQDWDMWLRLAKKYKFEYIPDILAIYYIHGNQIKFSQSKYIFGVRRVLDKYHDDFSTYPDILSNQYKHIGVLSYVVGDKATGTRYMVKSMKLRPLQNAYLHIISVYIIPHIYRQKALKVLIYGSNP